MSAAEVLQPHRAPTHPAVRAHRCGQGQGLTRFPLMVQATGPVMPLPHPRLDDFGTEERQDVCSTGCAMHPPPLHPLDAPPLLVFFSLSIGPALGPAHARRTGSASGAGGGPGSAGHRPRRWPTQRPRRHRCRAPADAPGGAAAWHPVPRPWSAPGAVCRRRATRSACSRPPSPYGPTWPPPPRARLPDTASAFFHEAPGLITLQSTRGHVASPAVMEALGVTSGPPEEARDRVFGDVEQASSGASLAPVASMMHDVVSRGLWDCGVEQRRATAFRACLATGAATEPSETVRALDFAHGEISLTGETTPLACGLDTRESVTVGALPAGLLSHSCSLASGTSYAPTPLVNPAAMITGHYQQPRHQSIIGEC